MTLARKNVPCQGVWLGWDINNPFGRPHLPHWQQMTDYLKELLDEGLGSNLMLSHDWNKVLTRVSSPGFFHPYI